MDSFQSVKIMKILLPPPKKNCYKVNRSGPKTEPCDIKRKQQVVRNIQYLTGPQLQVEFSHIYRLSQLPYTFIIFYKVGMKNCLKHFAKI